MSLVRSGSWQVRESNVGRKRVLESVTVEGICEGEDGYQMTCVLPPCKWSGSLTMLVVCLTCTGKVCKGGCQNRW
jgi:hypothetical protein